jgi:hypothetical protein
MPRNSVSSWLWEHHISIGDVVMITGASMETTWRTVRGQEDDPRVLAFLRKKGCPADLIDNRKA